jgi:hypothetical protein
VDIFKGYLDNQDKLTKEDRYYKIHNFMEDEGYQKQFHPYEKKVLADLGFSVLIKADWIKRFTYHSMVWNNKNKMNTVCVPPTYSIDGQWMDSDYYSSQCMQYVGDIPDSVIEKATKIRETKLIMGMTLHSMYPLPSEFVKCDPILIGWRYCPCIYTDKQGKFHKLFEPEAQGVIIAVWDYDKEFLF